MSRLILTQITIKKERSISSTVWYYLLKPPDDQDNPPPDPDRDHYGTPPPIISTTGYSGWSTTEPAYQVGDDRVLYKMVQTNFSDGTYTYSTPTISSSYEASKQAYQEIIDAQGEIAELSELGLKEGYFWYNTTYIPAGTLPAYPIGAYVASGLSGTTFNTKNSDTYGINSWFNTQGLKIRYNAIPLAELSSSELAFYYPSTTASGAKKAISLGVDNAVTSLRFYGFNNINPDATLTANGLVLSKGGIEAGNYSSSPNSFIYLSTQDYNKSPTITINGNSSGWRQIIGNKFGVKNDGTLYAANAVISGQITVGSGSTIDSGTTVGGVSLSNIAQNASAGAQAASDLSDFETTVSNTYATQDAAQGYADEAEANASYSVEIKASTIDYDAGTATLVATPYYQGSTSMPTGVIISYQWYKDSVSNSNPDNRVGTNSNTLSVTSSMGLNHVYICVIS